MSIEKGRIDELVKEYGGNENNSGKCEVQVAIFTDRIRNITEHLQNNKKDHAGRRGLIQLVAKRRKLLKYLKRHDLKGYSELIQKLKIRK